jgi:hypothetical protein
MALDFSKFGTPVESSSALDFSKFGTPVEPSSTPDFSKFGTPVGGTPDTIEKIRKEAADARKRWQSTELAPSTTAPVEGTGGAAFGVFASQNRQQRQQNIQVRKEEQKALEIPYQELITRDDYLDVINKGMKAVGERPFDPAKETRKQFVDRAYTNRRLTEYNNVFGLVPELIAIKNSGADKANQIAQFRQLYSEAEDNPNKLKAGLDVAYAILTDASTYLGFGFGKAASSIVARTGVKSLAEEATTRAAQKTALGKRAKLAEVGVSAGTESAIGGASYATQLRLDQETARQQGKEVPEFSAAGAAMATLLPGVVSGAVSAKLTKAPTIKERGEIIGEELVRRNITPANPTAPLTKDEEAISNALSKDFETVHSQYVKAYGKALLNEVDPAAAVTDSKVQEAYSKTAVRFALQLMKDNPEQFGFNPAKELVSDAINRTLSQVDKIDDAALESAINKAGLRPDQFAAMTKTTASEAGQILQAYSVAAKALKRMREIDPAFDKRMNELYGVDNNQVSALTRFGEGVRTVERTSKALITSGIDTLARNIVGNTIGVSMKTGVQMLEGIRYSVGTALDAADGKKLATLRQTMGDSFKDAIGTFYYMRKNGLAEDITEKVLENNPSLLSRISSATPDVDLNAVSNTRWEQSLDKLSRWSQTLNNAMDGMYRRASFAASLDRELRRVGVDLYKDVLAQNKDIPTSVLKRALDDSFKDTFSYSPQMYAKSFSAFEDLSERAGAYFVKGAELPTMSLFIPFPRFVTNAIAFQYKYSPLGFVGATEYVAQAAKLRAAGQLEKAEMVAREGATKAIQATVGLGMLAAAYDYRKNNLDSNWNELKTPSGTVDVKSIFPIAQYLGLGDWFARDVANGTGQAPSREIMESIVGFKAPAGTQHTFLQSIQEVFQSDEKGAKALESLGKISGDFLGRFTQPFVTKQIFDMFDLIRGDEAIMARDPNVLNADTMPGRMAEAAVQRVQAKLPVVKESLPPAVTRFKEQETPMKEGEFFNRLVGFRPITEPTAAEKEIIKHSVDLYKVYGRPTGDKDFDRLFIQNVNKNALDFVDSAIKRSDYSSFTSEQKQARINSAIEKAVEEAKKVTEATFAQEFPAKLNRIEYLREPAKVKKIVNELYAKDHKGRTMEEDKAYDLLPKYKELALKPTKFAKGGMVQQMHQLFGR